MNSNRRPQESEVTALPTEPLQYAANNKYRGIGCIDGSVESSLYMLFSLMKIQ